MTEYIEKAALYSALANLEGEAMKKYIDFSVSNPSIATEWERIMNERTRIKHLVADFPAYDIGRVKPGHWRLGEEQNEEENKLDIFTYVCSNCGAEDVHRKGIAVPYCWNCGALMYSEEKTYAID